MKKRKVTEKEFAEIQQRSIQMTYESITDSLGYVPDCMVDIYLDIAASMNISYIDEELEVIPDTTE
jgi:hypothetical protein